MNLYKEIIKNEVFPAMGCTEPISVAYAASITSEGINEPPESVIFIVSQGVYKNGLAVTIPNAKGEKGNLIAGVMGLLIAKPYRKMEILKDSTPDILQRAKEIINQKKASIKALPVHHDFFIEVNLKTKSHEVKAVIAKSHTSVIYLEKDGKIIIDKRNEINEENKKNYKDEIKKLRIKNLIEIAENIDKEDMDYLKKGINMNLALSKEGEKLRKVGSYLLELKEKNYLLDDIFSSTKILAACAVDARMDGFPLPAMSSGGSGNQGIVASLIPYNIGKHFEIPEEKILKSIALSHLINSYIKTFTGELSPICGCAIASGVGAACAIVYQQKGADIRALNYAINNVVSDIGGMLCDGAKSGCALKVVSSVDSAIRGGYLGIHHYGIAGKEGFVGNTGEETIKNLSKITEIGMSLVDDTIVGIMSKKAL